MQLCHSFFLFHFRDLLLQRLFERGVTQQDLEKTLHRIPFVSQNIGRIDSPCKSWSQLP